MYFCLTSYLCVNKQQKESMRGQNKGVSYTNPAV